MEEKFFSPRYANEIKGCTSEVDGSSDTEDMNSSMSEYRNLRKENIIKEDAEKTDDFYMSIIENSWTAQALENKCVHEGDMTTEEHVAHITEKYKLTSDQSQFLKDFNGSYWITPGASWMNTQQEAIYQDLKSNFGQGIFTFTADNVVTEGIPENAPIKLNKAVKDAPKKIADLNNRPITWWQSNAREGSIPAQKILDSMGIKY